MYKIVIEIDGCKTQDDAEGVLDMVVSDLYADCNLDDLLINGTIHKRVGEDDAGS